MNDVGNQASNLLNLEQAADLAGVTTATLQIYVASGELTPDSSGLFQREDVLKIAEMQRGTVEEIRHKAIENLTAETVIARRAIEHLAKRYANLQSEIDSHTRAIAANDARLSESETRIHTLGDSLVTQSDRISNLQSQRDAEKRSLAKLQTDLEEQAKLIGLLKNVSELAKRQSEADQQTLKLHKQSIELLQSLVESHRQTIEEQSQIVAHVSAELAETRARVDGIIVQQMAKPLTENTENAPAGVDPSQIAALQEDIYKRLNKIQDSFDVLFQARSQITSVESLVHKTIAEQAEEIDRLRSESKNTKELVQALRDSMEELKDELRRFADVEKEPARASSKRVDEQPTIRADAVATPIKEKEETGPAPAQYGVIREIEFNTLIERMGYPRLDQQKDDGNIVVPHNDAIRKYLAKNELGCDPDEVEFRGITRAGWNMVQYQRVQRKSGRRGWIGANN